MKALRSHKDGLKIDDVPTPTPGPKDVLIKVHTASITRGELEWVEAGGRGDCPIPGYDVAGTIDAVGAEVTRFKKGDEVFGLINFEREGAAAEHTLANENVLALKPAELSFEEAAAVPLSTLTVWQALFKHAEAQEGQRVLINGAGGEIFELPFIL
jgi:NADPH:quinone reductase-like Zn-dependent oxidoreductase